MQCQFLDGVAVVDRWFGTWREAPRLGHEHIPFGIAEAPAPHDVTLLKSLLMPFRRQRRAAWPETPFDCS